MKNRGYIKHILFTICFALSVFSLSGQEKKETRNLSEVYRSGEELHLANFSGINLDAIDQSRLIKDVGILLDSFGVTTHDIFFPAISTISDNGLNENYLNTLEKITSETYILFCYVLNPFRPDKVIDFYVTVEGDFKSKFGYENSFIINLLEQETQGYFDTSPTERRLFESVANGLEHLISLGLDDGTDIEISKDIGTEGKEGFYENLNKQFKFANKYFVTPCGKVIKSPNNTLGILFTDKQLKGDTQKAPFGDLQQLKAMIHRKDIIPV